MIHPIRHERTQSWHQLLVALALLALIVPLVMAATITKVFKIENETGEGLEFRTPSSLLVQKNGIAGEFILNADLDPKIPKKYDFTSGAGVDIKTVPNGILIKVTGQRPDKITLAPSDRGWVLHWPAPPRPKEEVLPDPIPIAPVKPTKGGKAVKGNPKEPPPPDSLSVSMQASHFINLLRTIQPRDVNVTLLDQGRTAAQSRKYPDAIRLFAAAARDSNIEVQAKLLLAQTYQLMGDKKKYEIAWKDYVEATKRERSKIRVDSIVAMNKYAFPKMSTLPPLELPEDLKDLVVPEMQPDAEATTMEASAASDVHGIEPEHKTEPAHAVTEPTTTPVASHSPIAEAVKPTHSEPVHAAPAHSEPVPVKHDTPPPVQIDTTPKPTHAEPVYIPIVRRELGPDTLMKDLDSSNAEPVMVKVDTVNNKWLTMSVAGYPLVPIAVTAIASLALSIGFFMFLMRRRDKKMLKRLSGAILPPPVTVPRVVSQQKLPDRDKAPAPTLPASSNASPPSTGTPPVASSPAPNSTLSVEDQLAKQVTDSASTLSNDDLEDDEDLDSDKDSKRQMIYELEDSGLTVRDIAQKLGIGQDEVRTFLSLRKAKNE